MNAKLIHNSFWSVPFESFRLAHVQTGSESNSVAFFYRVRNHNGYSLHPTSKILQLYHMFLTSSYLRAAAQGLIVQALVIFFTEIEMKYDRPIFEGTSQLSSCKQISSTSVSRSLKIMILLMMCLIEILQGKQQKAVHSLC